MSKSTPHVQSVCHITSAHPPNDIRIFHKECLSLSAKGYDVHLVATGSLGAEAKGVTHHTIPANIRMGRIGRILFRSWQAYRLAQATPAKVFHFHDPEILPYGLLLKWQGHTVIYDAHEDLPRDVMMKDWIPRYLRRGVSVVIEVFENFVARRLDKVVCATPFIAKRFHAIGASAIDVKNFPHLNVNGHELEAPLVSERGASNVMCYVGIISIPRGIIEMIKAAAHVNAHFILAGNFIDKNTESIVRSLPEWDKVDYRGIVSRQAIREIFKESSLGLCLFHPSDAHNESLPNKLFEYMSASLPVVSSNFVGWRSIVEQAQCGLCVNPQNLDEITQAIQWLFNHPHEGLTMGQRGRLAVENQYNWEREGERLLDVYAQLFEREKVRARS